MSARVINASALFAARRVGTTFGALADCVKQLDDMQAQLRNVRAEIEHQEHAKQKSEDAQ